VSQDDRLKTSKTSARGRRSAFSIALRLVLVASVIGVLLIAAGLLLRVVNSTDGLSGVEINLQANPNLNPAKAVALGGYLALNREALETPVDPAGEPEIFRVNAGETAGQIAASLRQQGLIADETLFLRYLTYYGLDTRLEAGTYQLSAAMTIPEIAYQLTDAEPAQVTIGIPEGWRREQIADWIDSQPDLPFTGEEFLAATGPGASVPPDLSFAGEIPPGASLEGFLFPETYRLDLDATAEELVERMLRTFDERFTPEMRAQVAGTGLTLYEVVTVASIVEREARVADERSMIADVYLNRLEQGMRLEADPTVQYAMGYQPDTGQWWNLNLTQADYYAVDSPYNTYLYAGLPPGPIANPGIDAIQAVLRPADTPYLYFRTTCDGSGRHNFAITYEEHLANACP